MFGWVDLGSGDGLRGEGAWRRRLFGRNGWAWDWEVGMKR
jgi:hypothetical protein